MSHLPQNPSVTPQVGERSCATLAQNRLFQPVARAPTYVGSCVSPPTPGRPSRRRSELAVGAIIRRNRAGRVRDDTGHSACRHRCLSGSDPCPHRARCPVAAVANTLHDPVNLGIAGSARLTDPGQAMVQHDGNRSHNAYRWRQAWAEPFVDSDVHLLDLKARKAPL